MVGQVGVGGVTRLVMAQGGGVKSPAGQGGGRSGDGTVGMLTHGQGHLAGGRA